MCRDVESSRQAAAIADRIAAALRERIDIGVETLDPKASVGVAWTAGATDADALVAAADSAMYDSKREARGRACASAALPTPQHLR